LKHGSLDPDEKVLGSNTIQSEGGWLGQLALQISELGWNGHDIEVKTAGTFKKDKFIVLQNKTLSAKEKSSPNPDLKAHHQE
jgi:hypothetical protein|tara:strand:+ start:113 stop:358 length:246 start_codon:yes stop_codon:yes gene_type:complete